MADIGTNVDTLRPDSLDEYFGQPKLKRRLTVRVEAALRSFRPLDHILLTGPPGSGKTSLAKIVADWMNVEFESLIMPVNDRTLVRIVGTFSGVLLLDELHRASPKQQESLLPLLEFGYLSRPNGQKVESCWLTIVGATTEQQGIIKPLLDRFTERPQFEDYSPNDLSRIACSMAAKAGIELPDETAAAIGLASGGIPRNVRRLVLAARDLIDIGMESPSVEDILELAGTFADGLSEAHLDYLNALHMLGDQAGVNRLATYLRVHEAVCLDLERLLVEKGFVTYGTQGRELTSKGARRLREVKAA